MLCVAGLSGALGVGLAAAASHTASPLLSLAGSFLQLHAPALIGISLLARNRLSLAAGWVMVAGLVLFCGDLVAHSLLGASPFPLAAPIGGGVLILGWIGLAISAYAGWRRMPG